MNTNLIRKLQVMTILLDAFSLSLTSIRGERDNTINNVITKYKEGLFCDQHKRF